MALDPESLATWYFRLNGFFTMKNFIVHPDLGRGQRTDIDVFGVRLPFRQELVSDPMEDDGNFTKVGQKAFLAIVEVKSGRIKINSTWREPALRNVHRFLRAAGPFDLARVDEVANAIYQRGSYERDPQWHVALVGVGRSRNAVLAHDLSGLMQITWADISSFIFKRFSKYNQQKEIHMQWDPDARALWNIWECHRDSSRKFDGAILAMVGKR
jgi:hypothetical protein